MHSKLKVAVAVVLVTHQIRFKACGSLSLCCKCNVFFHISALQLTFQILNTRGTFGAADTSEALGLIYTWESANRLQETDCVVFFNWEAALPAMKLSTQAECPPTEPLAAKSDLCEVDCDFVFKKMYSTIK